MKVKTMIAISAILFAILPLLVGAGLSGFLVTSNANDRFDEIIKSMASNGAVALQTAIDMAQSDVEKISGYEYVKNAASDGVQNENATNYIKSFMDNSSYATSVSLVDSSGRVICGSDTGSAVVNYAKYAEYDNDVLYFNDVASDNSGSSESTMFIKHTVGKCTLFINYDISKAKTMIHTITTSSAFYDSNSEIYIVDSRGIYSGGTAINTNFSTKFTSSVESVLSTLADNQVSNIVKYNGYIAALVKVGGETGLAAIVACPENKVNVFYNAALIPIIVTAVALALVCVGFAFIVSATTTAPLKTIEATLEKIRRGDHEARISNMSSNEYGQMSRAFNNLVDEIVISEDRYKVISDMSDSIIFEWNFKTNEVIYSNNFNKLFSYRAPSDHFGDSFLLKAKIHPDDIERYREDLNQLEKGKNFERNEYRIKDIYGNFIWILMRTETIRDKEGVVQKVVGVMVNIDRAKKSEQNLTEQASYDALTELYNRETIEGHIDNEISLSEMRKSEMAVLFVDVDDFKHFNDNYSHATGDQVLKFMGKTIKEAVNGIGFAGRYGGDEFIMLVRDAEVNDPAAIAQKLIDTLSAGFDADIGERLSVSVSIGIAVIKDDYNTRVEYLIGKADDAMYSVKKSGKSNYAFI